MSLICIILKTGLFEVCMRSIYVTKTRPHLLEILAYVLLKKKNLYEVKEPLRNTIVALGGNNLFSILAKHAHCGSQQV